MFIDDERSIDYLERFVGTDEEFFRDMVVRRSSEAAIQTISKNGSPTFIAFDHDLGGTDTTRKVVLWLVDELLEGRIFMPRSFDWVIHSANPVGAKWLKDTLESVYHEFAGDDSYVKARKAKEE